MNSQGIIRLIIFKPWVCLFLVMCLFLVCLVLALDVKKNTTPYFLDKNHAERLKADALASVFSRSKETIVIVLKSKNNDIFTEKAIHLLDETHAVLSEIDLIELLPVIEKTTSASGNKTLERKQLIKKSLIEQYNLDIQNTKNSQQRKFVEKTLGQFIFPIRSVKSLINSDDIYESDDEIIVAPSFSLEYIEQWREGKGKTILQNPLLVDALVDRHAKSVAIQVELNLDPDDSDSISVIFHKIKSSVKPLAQAAGFDVYYSGTPVVNVEISQIMEKDNERYFPLIVVLIGMILFALFRSVWAAILSLGVSIITIVITFGLMTLFGITLNIVTTILPIFIITIGVTDAIHLLSKSKGGDHGSTVKQSIFNKVSKLYRAMLLTSLTTALGFFSLSFTEMINIQDFGIMVGLSSLIACAVSVFVLPALMSLISYQAKDETSSFFLFSYIEKLAQKQTIFRSRVLVFLLIIISAIGSRGFYVDQQNLNSFKETTQVRQDDKQINALLGGTVPVNIWIKSDQVKGVISSESLAFIEQLETLAREHEIVGYTVSVAGFLKHINTVMFPENTSETASSLSPEFIAQYLFLLEGGASRDLESVLELGQYQQTRLVIMANTDGSAELQNLLGHLKTALADKPEGLNVEFAGYGNMNAVAADEIVYGQLNSIVLSVLGLVILVSMIYRSLRIGLIAIFPLSMSLLVMVGIMGIFSIPLDIGSSLVCGVAFGIGIDYSIHIIEAYLRHIRQGITSEMAAENAMSDVSFPVLTSAFTISAGFSVLLISEFEPIYNLGLLVSSTMLISALVTLFVLPNFLRFIPAVKS
jgi:predicted RND superfamily exporter protein